MTALHPMLGYDRQLSDEPALCSRCCHEMPEGWVPLILFKAGSDKAWQYCADCEGPMFEFLHPRAAAR